MLFQLFCSVSFNILVIAASENSQTVHTYEKDERHRSPQAFRDVMKPVIPVNVTYFEKAENPLRIPTVTNAEDYKKTKKSHKKSPKRTIQKIIKKNRSKKRFFMNQAQSTTNQPNDDELDKFYAQEELAQKNENLTTMQAGQIKKHKWTRKSRYPMPFQKLRSMRDHKRNRRSDDRDLYIFTDLDEMEFLRTDDNNKGKDVVVKAHVKKYW